MINLMVSSKIVKVSQKRCLGTSIESFTGSSPSEELIKPNATEKMSTLNDVSNLKTSVLHEINRKIFKIL